MIEAHGGCPLGDLREPVGVVIGISDLRLAGDGHAGAAPGVRCLQLLHQKSDRWPQELLRRIRLS